MALSKDAVIAISVFGGGTVVVVLLIIWHRLRLRHLKSKGRRRRRGLDLERDGAGSKSKEKSAASDHEAPSNQYSFELAGRNSSGVSSETAVDSGFGDGSVRNDMDASKHEPELAVHAENAVVADGPRRTPVIDRRNLRSGPPSHKPNVWWTPDMSVNAQYGRVTLQAHEPATEECAALERPQLAQVRRKSLKSAALPCSEGAEQNPSDPTVPVHIQPSRAHDQALIPPNSNSKRFSRPGAVTLSTLGRLEMARAIAGLRVPCGIQPQGALRVVHISPERHMLTKLHVATHTLRQIMRAEGMMLMFLDSAARVDSVFARLKTRVAQNKLTLAELEKRDQDAETVNANAVRGVRLIWQQRASDQRSVTV